MSTISASVARACLDAGARIVNDVSALRDDPAMLPLLVERRVPVVLMHRRGRQEDKYEGPAYRDVVEDVRAFLLERAGVCEAAGVAHDRIAIDPGIGFGKSVEENLALIEGSGRLAAAGYPVLVGSSRKGFIGQLTGIKQALPIKESDLNASLVFDMVYTPIETPLLKLAKSKGLAVISGVEMFVQQGARQFEIWTGKPAPENEMLRVVELELRKRAQP